MAENWEVMARDSLLASKVLFDKGHHRSAISRAYFSAYSAVTNELSSIKGVKFGFEDNNPVHRKLPSLALHHLPERRFTMQERRNIKTQLSNLWKARIEADYGPRVNITKAAALDAVREASSVMAILRISHEQTQSIPS